MPQFTRRTIVAAADLIADFGHSAVDRFLLDYGLENAGIVGTLRDRANAVARHLLNEPDRIDEDGRNLTDRIVADLVGHAIVR